VLRPGSRTEDWKTGEPESRGESPVLFPRFPGSPVLRFLPLMLFFLYACGSPSDPQVILYPQQGDPISVSVEIADTQEERSFGLMYRRELPEFHGMLFIFPREEPLSFWMKNTPLPL